MADALGRHCARGAPLRLLTTTYTGSTEGRALDALADLGAEVRVSYDTASTRLHAKAWDWQVGDFRPYDPAEFAARVGVAGGPEIFLSPIELRLEPFQERLLEEIALARQLGRHRNLLVSATGTGKTQPPRDLRRPPARGPAPPRRARHGRPRRRLPPPRHAARPAPPPGRR
jgi:hypothetical protein